MSTIYRDKKGNILIDFKDGVGDIAVNLILIADLNQAYNSIRDSITVPITENQALALASFALDIGTENFLSSKVLASLNKSMYQNVPHLMAEWVGDGRNERVVRRSELAARRAYEGELFQTPSAVSIQVANGKDNLNFLQQAESLRTLRREYFENLS